MPLHTLHLGSLSSMAFSSLPHPSHWSPRASSKPQRGQVPSTNRSARNLSMKDSNSNTEYGTCISKLLQTEGMGGVAGALQKPVSQKPVNGRQQYKQSYHKHRWGNRCPPQTGRSEICQRMSANIQSMLHDCISQLIRTVFDIMHG